MKKQTFFVLLIYSISLSANTTQNQSFDIWSIATPSNVPHSTATNFMSFTVPASSSGKYLRLAFRAFNTYIDATNCLSTQGVVNICGLIQDQNVGNVYYISTTAIDSIVAHGISYNEGNVRCIQISDNNAASSNTIRIQTTCSSGNCSGNGSTPSSTTNNVGTTTALTLLTTAPTNCVQNP